MFRFKIYRNKADLSSAEKEVDNLRYDRTMYSFERMLSPYYTDLNFKYGKGERMFFRIDLDGAIDLKDEDFEWANDIRLDSNEADRYRILAIEEKKDGVWTEIWVGFFSIIHCEFNLDECVVKVSEFNVWDRYSILLENIEREKDFFSAWSRTIRYYLDDYDYEHYVLTENYDVTASSVDPAEPVTQNEIFPNTDDKYTLYSKSLVVTAVSGLTCYYTITKEYRRNYVNSTDDPGASWENGGDIAGSSGIIKWIRWYDDYGTAVLPGYNYNSVPGKYYYSGSYYVQQYTYTIERNLPTLYENERARRLNDVMFYLLYDLCFRGTNFLPTSAFISEFLNSVTNPITGEANDLRNLHTLQLTDAKDTSDPATRAMISFDDIESWFKSMNCGWYLMDSGYMRIEHQKYFDQGLSYSDNVVGLDITADPTMLKQARATQKFTFNNKNLPKVERFEFLNSEGQDFVGLPIFYRGNMANWGEGNEQVYGFTCSMDLQAAIDAESDKLDGFLLLACDSDGDVISGASVLSGGNIQNFPLATSTLHDRYWRYGRPVSSGIMNGQYTVFDSVSPNFAQESFEVAYCDDFDPYKLVKTEYGNGRVVSATRSLIDNRLTLELRY